MMLEGRDRSREVTTYLALPLVHVVNDLHVVNDRRQEVQHDTTQQANNRIEWDHGLLKADARPHDGPHCVGSDPRSCITRDADTS